MHKVLIVGAGQLGSRYLQGLSKAGVPLTIIVFDVSLESIGRAEIRWREVDGDKTQHRVRYVTDLAKVPSEIDLAIIATLADVRPSIVARLVERIVVKYWVLEKVLTQSEAGLDKIQACIRSNSKAWVNTPRRMMPWHQQVKATFGMLPPLTLNIQGDLWGLACNAVHFLDLLAWWTGETLQLVNTERLDSDWFQSKRPGNWEIGGTLVALFSGGSQALLTAKAGGPAVSTMEVSDGKSSWEMNEVGGIARRSDGFIIPGRLLYQSEISSGLVEGILTNGYCDLPTLAESIDLHRVFIGSMHEHWRRSGHPTATFVPIT